MSSKRDPSENCETAVSNKMQADEQTQLSPTQPVLPPVPCHMLRRVDDDEEVGHQEKVCRICLEEDDPESMIAPCKCKGSAKWVHRSCLNLWRINEKDRAFARCTECHFQYHFIETNQRANYWRRTKFCFFVSRDICVVTLLLQLVIVFFAWLTFLVDQSTNLGLQELLDSSINCPQMDESEFWCNQKLAVFYLLGLLELLVVLGFYGSAVLCCNGCTIPDLSNEEASAPREHNNNTQRRRRASYYRRQRHLDRNDCCIICVDCPTSYYSQSGGGGCCDCCGNDGDADGDRRRGRADSDCCTGGDVDSCRNIDSCCTSVDCGNECGQVLLVIFLVLAIAVAVAMAVIGFLVGLFIATLLVQRVIQRHLFLIQKKHLVEEFEVRDLSGLEICDESSTWSTRDVPAQLPPNLNPDDEARLRRLGLL